MEEQPIDDLFRRKLYDAESEPNHTTWSALQGRLSGKRIISLWQYVAVAAVLMMIGSFGWWAVLTNNKANNQLIVTKKVVPTVASSVSRKQQELADVDKIQKPLEIQSVGKLSIHQVESQTSGQKANSIRAVAYKARVALSQQTNIAFDKVEMIQTDTSQAVGVRLSAKPMIREINTKAILAAIERTLIVSIAQPQPLPTVITPIKSEVGYTADSNNRKSGFGMLLRKAKRLKDSEVFALSATGSAKINRRGIGKVLEEIKESIKNDSADR